MNNTLRTRTVVIVDRAKSGYSPVTVNATVPWICPVCGGPRGELRWHCWYESGEGHSAHVWDNPCGHVDMYSAVIAEAKAFQVEG